MWRFFGVVLAIKAVLFAAQLTAQVQRALVATPFAIEIAAGCNGVEAMLIGYLALIPFRAWGVVFAVLKTLSIQAGPATPPRSRSTAGPARP